MNFYGDPPLIHTGLSNLCACGAPAGVSHACLGPQPQADPITILARLDAIERELRALRELLK